MLTFWRDAGLLEASSDSAAARTLVAAGLIEAAPGDPHPDRHYYHPVAAARRWFRNDDPAEKTQPFLCFARRVVGGVSLVPDGSVPTLRYTYSLQDPPRGMARPEMLATFPNVALAYGQTFVSEEMLRYDHGRLGLDPIYNSRIDSPFLAFGVDFIGATDAERVEVLVPDFERK